MTARTTHPLALKPQWLKQAKSVYFEAVCASVVSQSPLPTEPTFAAAVGAALAPSAPLPPGPVAAASATTAASRK